MCRHEESVPAKAPKHSSQNISQKTLCKASAENTASASKPAPTSPLSAAYLPESTPRASVAPPKHPASSAASLHRSKQTTVGPPDANARGSRVREPGPPTRWLVHREAAHSVHEVCFGTHATFLVTISGEFAPRKCYVG